MKVYNNDGYSLKEGKRFFGKKIYNNFNYESIIEWVF
jgi:hypothetical protein